MHYNYNILFENDVKMYGTQTDIGECGSSEQFENDVKMYGTQTKPEKEPNMNEFENDVKMYGTQTMATRIILCTAV